LTTTSTTATEFFQQSPIPSSTNIFTSSLENPFGKDLPKNYTNPFSAAPLAQNSNLMGLSEPFKDDSLDLLQVAGNGYQKLPPYCSAAPLHSVVDNDAVDHHLAAKLNRMLYTQSPQLPRKTYELTSNANVPHMGSSQSPFMQRKFPTNDGGNYPYKPLQQQQPSSTFSPVIRKRYQEGHLVSEDLEFRILHGNTSPIVLQRFYHQQNQLKDQKEADELRAIRLQSASPNHPFTQSSIPVKSNSPLPSLRYQMPRNNLHNYEPLPTTYNNASHRVYESQIPQLQSRMVLNGTMYRPHHQQLQQHQQPMYDNVRAQMACPGSPQLDRLRQNLEKPNFYERHQKLPVEIENPYQQMEMNKNQNNGLTGDNNKNKDKGKPMFLLNTFECEKKIKILMTLSFTAWLKFQKNSRKLKTLFFFSN
jgi:hypothetical protein